MDLVRISGDQPFPLTGGKLPFNADFVPEGYRIDRLDVEADLTVTAPVGGVTSAEQTRLFDSLQMDRRVRIDAMGDDKLEWVQQGKDLNRPTELLAGAGQAVNYIWSLTWQDDRFVSPHDFSPATDFYKGAGGSSFNVYFANPSTVLAGFLVTAGNVRIVAHLSKLDGATIPASVLVGFEEVNAKSVRLPAGRLVDLVLAKTDGADVTDAELGDIILSIDGKDNLLENARLAHLLRRFNWKNAKGTGLEAVAGVEGEALPFVTPAPMAPLWTTGPGAKATKLARANKYFTLAFTGTLALTGIARLYFRIIEEVDEVASRKAASKLGMVLGPNDVIEGKTATKTGLPKDAPFAQTHGVMARRVAKKAA